PGRVSQRALVHLPGPSPPGHRRLATRLQRSPPTQQLRSYPTGPVRCQPPSTTSQQRSNLQPWALSVITGTASGGRSGGPLVFLDVVVFLLLPSRGRLTCRLLASMHRTRPYARGFRAAARYSAVRLPRTFATSRGRPSATIRPPRSPAP